MRGHHLDRIAGLDMSFDEYSQLMIKDGYSKTKEDPFTVETYGFLKRLRENPLQKVILVSDEEDLICKRCSEEMKSKCVRDAEYQKAFYKSPFWKKDIPEPADIIAAKEAGLEMGSEYTVKRIIEATRKQSKAYKKRLENR